MNGWQRPLVALLFWLLALAWVGPAAAGAGTWLLIDTESATAMVMRGDETVLNLPNVSFGRGGVAPIHLLGDETTPLGEFRITRVDRQSKFHVFLGLNYPTLQHLDTAHRAGYIDDTTYRDALSFALDRGHTPQRTPLGGYIGIHGLGNADPSIHKRFNWTQGCIALTDSQINQLLRYVSVGTPVVIQ